MCWWVQSKGDVVVESWESPRNMELHVSEQSFNYTLASNHTEKPAEDRLECRYPSVSCLPTSRFAKGYCLNRGICCNDGSMDYCVCDPIGMFSGKRCNHSIVQASSASSFGNGGIALIVTLVTVLLVVIISLVVFWYLRKQNLHRARRAEVSQVPREESRITFLKEKDEEIWTVVHHPTHPSVETRTFKPWW